MLVGQARSYNPPGSNVSPNETGKKSFSLDDRLLNTNNMELDSKCNYSPGMEQVKEFEDFNNRFASMLAERSPVSNNQPMEMFSPAPMMQSANYTHQVQSYVDAYNSHPLPTNMKQPPQFTGYQSLQRPTPYPPASLSYYEQPLNIPCDHNRRGNLGVSRSSEVSWAPGPQTNSYHYTKSPTTNALHATSRTQLKQQLMRQQLHQEEAKARNNLSQSYHDIHNDLMETQNKGTHTSKLLQMDHFDSNGHIQTSRSVPIDRISSPRSNQPRRCSAPHKSPVYIPVPGSLSDLSGKTKLENPTEYHVVESQKRKIRSKNSNGIEESNEITTAPVRPRSCVSQTGGSGTYEGNGATDYQLAASDPGQQSVNKIFRSLPTIEIKTSEDGSSCSSYINKNLYGFTDNKSTNQSSVSQYVDSPSMPESSGVSSISASLQSENSDVHVIEDQERVRSDNISDDNDAHQILKEFMTLDENIQLSGSPQARNVSQNEKFHMQDSPNNYGGIRSNNGTPQIPQIKTEPIPGGHIEMDAFIKERKKKDSHNQIERSRRYNINARIEELCELLPKNNDPYYSSVFIRRQYKGHILKATVDYIKVLKHSLDHYKQEEARRRSVEVENRALVERLHELESRMREHGIDIQPNQGDKRMVMPSILSSDVISSSTATQHTSFPPLLHQNTCSVDANCPSIFSQGNFTFGTDDSLIDNVLSPHREIMPPSNESSSTQEVQKVRPVSPASEMVFDSDNSVASLLYDTFGFHPEIDFYPDSESGFTPEMLDQIDFDTIEDEGPFASDPLFSSPQVSSPNSSRQSLDDGITTDIMDVPS